MSALKLGHLASLVLLAIISFNATAQGQVVIDQSNTMGGAFKAEDVFPPVGQSFRPSLSSIDFVDLKVLDTSTSSDSHTIQINVREGSITGTIRGSSMVLGLPDCFNFPSGPGCGLGGGGSVEVHIDFAAPVSLVPGDLYVLEVVTTGDIGVVYQLGGNPYPHGTAFFDGIAEANNDLWFREGTTIPEPSTMLLMIAALALVRVRSF